VVRVVSTRKLLLIIIKLSTKAAKKFDRSLTDRARIPVVSSGKDERWGLI